MVDSAWVALFPKEHSITIIQDVLDCSQSLQRPNQIEKRPEENLSRQLCKLLSRIRHYRTGPLEFYIESWLTDLESRADIRFSCGQGIETYFLIEAKRLFVTFPNGRSESLINQYINEGMMRFIEGRYAPYQTASAMLAYVYNNDISKAQCEVNTQITKNAKKLCLQKYFSDSMLPVTPSIHETYHDLKDKKFILYHLFVSVT